VISLLPFFTKVVTFLYKFSGDLAFHGVYV
jgi:hypothetical protein